MRYGVFGGTFDPPHIGHLILAAEAREQLALDRVLWVLTPDPPHKQGRIISPLNIRLAMLQAALKDAQKSGQVTFEVCRVEMDRPAPHYAVDTVNLLREQYPQAQLVYLMGGDSLDDLPTWHAPQAFVAACDEIGVMERVGRAPNLDALDQTLPGLKAKTRFVQTPRIEISSSWLRQRRAAGRLVGCYLTPGVYQVVERRKLYR